MRALVTGVAGFSGTAVARHLAALGWSVVGSHGSRREPVAAPVGIDLVRHDLSDLASTRALLRLARPDIVLHMAGPTGQSRGASSAEAFAVHLQAHAGATAILLEAAALEESGAVLLIPGSSAQFGDVAPERQPIGADAPYRPRTLYGVAKAAEAWAAAHYAHARGLKIVRTHTFNCIGPGQRADFVPAAFASQIAAMERGEAPPVLLVGNLAARRDVTDIRDVARAYVLAATRGQPGRVYNVCSGTAPTIADLVEGLRAHARVEFEVRRDPARMQAVDVAAQIGDATELARDTGWRPEIPLAQTLADIVEDWRGSPRNP
jgi:GDP-4-dehydro-6-deoxy-D-mannose reductase